MATTQALVEDYLAKQIVPQRLGYIQTTNRQIATALSLDAGAVSKVINNLARTGRLEVVKEMGLVIGIRLTPGPKALRPRISYNEIPTPAIDSYVRIRASGSPLHRTSPIAEEGLRLKAQATLLRQRIAELEHA